MEKIKQEDGRKTGVCKCLYTNKELISLRHTVIFALLLVVTLEIRKCGIISLYVKLTTQLISLSFDMCILSTLLLVTC